MRGSIHLLQDVLSANTESSIYITEQVTPLFNALTQRFPLLIGSEFLGETVKWGQTNGNGVRNESLTALTFEANSFDFILSFDVLEHIPDYKVALAEIVRCLKPGGRLMRRFHSC